MKCMSGRQLKFAFMAAVFMTAIILWSPYRGSDTYSNVTDLKSKAVATTRPTQKERLPITHKCKSLIEFSDVDLSTLQFRGEVCESVSVYSKLPDNTYPVCNLKKSVEQSLIQRVQNRSTLSHITGVGGQRVPIFVYREYDLISNAIIKNHDWEGGQVKLLMKIARSQPDTTFIDIGSNIGVYTVSAAAHGLPTLSLDANIRNLLRLRLSLMQNLASLNSSRLLWNGVSADLQSLMYMAMPTDCNIGGAPKWVEGISKFYVKDNIAVMPISSSVLTQMVHTRNAVMKMDLEGHESVFVSNIGSLFQKLNVMAVQIEWCGPHVNGKESFDIIVNHFLKFNFVAYTTPQLTKLDMAKVYEWVPKHSRSIDVLMVKADAELSIIGKARGA